MTSIKIYQKNIRNKIKQNENIMYNKKDLKILVEIICLENKNKDANEIISFVAQYIHYSAKDDKFFFNLKKKQTKSLGDYITMLKFSNDDHSDSDSEIDCEELKQIDVNLNKSIKLTPYGTQTIHDEQFDDMLDEVQQKMVMHFNNLRAIVSPDQRSEEWYKMRSDKITASDGGQVLGQNKYDQQFNFILKKTIGSSFKSNEACYHGKKFEQIATNIYEYRMNVRVDSFGLLAHPTIDFLGASPDGICNMFKYDGKHLSKYVGRMLEIKCPLVRKIIKSGDIINNICPIYYWIQVQLQLECCDLDECDFWQCDIREYNNREEFIIDTDQQFQFRSKTYGLEKGCLIQLMPNKMKNEPKGQKYNEIMYEEAIFLYPPKIEMDLMECDKWVNETVMNFGKNPQYNSYYIDRIIYWHLKDSHCVTINRDKGWFIDNLPKLKKMWDYVIFFRNNKDKLDLLQEYINSLSFKKNKDIMDVIEKLSDINSPKYKEYIRSIKTSIQNSKTKKEEKYVKEDNDMSDYMFV